MTYLKIASVVFAVTLLGIALADHHKEEHQKPHYYFEYGVHDPHTHDHKSHYEHRDGDHVHGAYILKEPDGTTRIVKYTVGPKTGFQAHVERIGHAHHPSGGKNEQEGENHHSANEGHYHGGENHHEAADKEEYNEQQHYDGKNNHIEPTWGPFGF